MRADNISSELLAGPTVATILFRRKSVADNLGSFFKNHYFGKATATAVNYSIAQTPIKPAKLLPKREWLW
jgi:hypothetical protein